MSEQSELQNQKYSSNQLNRTFARRIGKRLSSTKKQILEEILPKCQFITEKQNFLKSSDEVIMEIGFGMGDHFLQQMRLKPNATFLGAEVYLNGVAQFLECALEAGVISSVHDNNNLLLWPDDVDLLFDNIPDNSIDILYILFPDPWPKKKHNKKRMLNKQRLDTIKNKLKSKGTLIFATDIDDYFNSTYKLIDEDDDLEFIDTNFDKPHQGYVATKYNKKALREGRTARFMRIKNL